MVPLTDAWVEFSIGGVRQRRQAAALVINREQIDWISNADDEDILSPEMPTMPVAAGQGPLVKDFTGQILIADEGAGA